MISLSSTKFSRSPGKSSMPPAVAITETFLLVLWNIIFFIFSQPQTGLVTGSVENSYSFYRFFGAAANFLKPGLKTCSLSENSGSGTVVFCSPPLKGGLGLRVVLWDREKTFDWTKKRSSRRTRLVLSKKSRLKTNGVLPGIVKNYFSTQDVFVDTSFLLPKDRNWSLSSFYSGKISENVLPFIVKFRAKAPARI